VQPAKRQRIGNQIDAAMIFTRANQRKSRKWSAGSMRKKSPRHQVPARNSDVVVWHPPTARLKKTNEPQEVAGDHAAAQKSWTQARTELEPFLKEQPGNSRLMGYLALINMGLDDKAAALTLAERAIATAPIEKDVLAGPIPIEILARVAAQMGEPDRAIAALQRILSTPGSGALAENVPLTPALLRLDPMFDPLRNDPRFQKLVASPAPIER
jgi:predicted Zn-dependent protease